MSFRVVIPARHASQRLPGKPLALIAGRPLIQHVHACARASGAGEVVVATDDARIADACRGFGAEVCMTSEGHRSGTDRIAEVARRSGWPEADIVVNLQGDEPLMPPALLDQVAALLGDGTGDIATLCWPVASLEEFVNSNVVKVVTDAHGCALYFSRAPIPWHREGTSGAQRATRFEGAMRHLGLYAYRVEALQRMSAAPPCAVEEAEQLEQLRALWLGMVVRVAEAAELPGPGVDTEDDLARVRRVIEGEGARQ